MPSSGSQERDVNHQTPSIHLFQSAPASELMTVSTMSGDDNVPTVPANKSGRTTETVSLVNDQDESLVIGEEIFDESDSDVADSRLRFYSDVDCSAEELKKCTPSPTKHDSKSGKKKVKKETTCRLSLRDRIRCIRLSSRFINPSDVQKVWKKSYGTNPPSRKAIAALNEKFQKTGSVADIVRTGRPKSSRNEATVSVVEEAIRKDPNKSIRNLSKDLGISQAAVHRIKREYEDSRNTLKNENQKLKDKLNEALKRIVMLERRVAKKKSNDNKKGTGSTCKKRKLDPIPEDMDTLVLTEGIAGDGTSIVTNVQLDSNSAQFLGTHNQITIPSSVLRLQQGGHETIHIISIPQTSSHQLFSIEGSSTTPIQFTLPTISSPSVVSKRSESVSNVTNLPSTSA